MEISKNYFEDNINIIFLYLSIIVIGYKFISSINFFSKKKFDIENLCVNRHKHLKIYELLVNYLQFISILSTFNIKKFDKLTNFNSKINWIILYNINLVKIENNDCIYISSFLNAHLIFFIGLFAIIGINLFINYIYDYLYNWRLNKKNSYLIFVFKHGFLIIPHLQIQWIIINLIGLIYNDISIINSKCDIYYMLGTGLFIIIPFLFSMYIIATIKNRVLQKEELIYNKRYSFSKNFKKYKSPIDIFNNGNWIIKENIIYCKSHLPLYIDFYNYKNYYYIILLSKIFMVSIISGSHINDYKIGFTIINTMFLLETILAIIIRFYNNIIINITYILSNISYIAVLLSLLIDNNDADDNVMYIIDITIISYILIIIFDIGFSIIYNIVYCFATL